VSELDTPDALLLFGQHGSRIARFEHFA
jgi:hypothetical protein